MKTPALRGFFFIVSTLGYQMTQRSILFYRHFDVFSGGHQKVFDYFSHSQASNFLSPYISFSSSSRWNSSNPWFPDNVSVDFFPPSHDYLFLAGMDWEVFKPFIDHFNGPVINLIQHVRHGLQDSDVYPFLKHKAFRICVSPEVEDAIKGVACGPVVTIPNGLEITGRQAEKRSKVFIAGYKNPRLASDFERHPETVVELKQLPRELFLYRLASTRIAVVLPHASEGFFLPALEAMKLAEIVVVPDCIGNRSFCIEESKHGGNCLMPQYTRQGILKALTIAEKILQNPSRLSRLRANAQATVNRHSLQAERKEFLDLMSNIDELWHEI